MNKNNLVELFRENNLAFLKSIPVHEIIFDERAKYMCQFGCKNYNRKYSCPPYSIRLKNKIMSNYQTAIIIATTYKIPQPSSRFQIRSYNRQKEYEIQRICSEMDSLFKLNKIDHFVLSGGSCKRCKCCSRLENNKCKKPDEKQTSMEAIGIDCIKTMHKIGFDFQMPNITSINRCGCIFINDKSFEHFDIKREPSNQLYHKPGKNEIFEMCERLECEFPRLYNKIDVIEINSIKKEKQICNPQCENYERNFSCPSYSDRIDINLWDYAILWEWSKNDFKKYRYNLALKTLHAGFYSIGNYFAISIRDSYCDECKECMYIKTKNPVCNFRKILAPSFQSQYIDPIQFGIQKYGLELI